MENYIKRDKRKIAISLTFEGGKEFNFIRGFKVQDAYILYLAGRRIQRYGCRKGFDELVTDMYLTSDIKQAYGIDHNDAARLRELLEDTDGHIMPGVCFPRLEIIRHKIKSIILKPLTS